MYRTVMAVFSGTHVDEALFRKGMKLAQQNDARLVLLNVRHLHEADHLGEVLSSDAFMGRGTVESLKRSVKEQRNHVVDRTLATMEGQARGEGLEVEVRTVKGPYEESITTAVRETSADVLVVEDRPECSRLKGRFDLIRVRRAGHGRRDGIRHPTANE